MADDRFDVIYSTTLNEYKPKLIDNITGKIALLKWLKEKGNMELSSGANEIVVPIMYAFGDNFKFYSAYETITLIPATGIGNAKYEWKQAATAVTISGKELRQNSGENAVINLLKAKIQQAELEFASKFNESLFSDGTGYDGNEIDGLGKLVTTDGTGTVGGINASTYTWWKNYHTAGTKSSTAFDNLLSKMRTCYNSISKGVDFPDIGITTQTVFEGYESKLTATINYAIGIVDNKMADFGFQNLKFKGMTLTWDDDCTSDAMYMLNSNYLKLVTHKDANFEPQDFIKPDDQDAKSCLILWMGNLVCSKRSALGIIYSIS